MKRNLIILLASEEVTKNANVTNVIMQELEKIEEEIEENMMKLNGSEETSKKTIVVQINLY